MAIPRRKHQRSFVLVVVLGMLVLIIILVVGFLGHVASQSKSSTSYRDQTGTLLLGDETVNLVKAQIDAATTASQAAAPALWASQPGAIRSMSSTGATTTYKLYSSLNLIETGTGTALKAKITADLPATTATAANDWSSSALWTDLNAPAVKSDGTFAYPIIDVVNDNTDLPAGTTAASPFASGSFNIDSTVANNPVGATRTATGQYPLPMPVRWLYVLKQGQVIAPDATSTESVVTFNNATPKPVSNPSNPALDNPIIGRIAFWTDDDTCRVNINTASYGTFWDTPHFTSPDDMLLAANQPVGKEYQRYPGHGAMTTLTLALPELASSPETAIGLTPRYYTGGSKEGTVASSDATTALGSPAKLNRLYASVDELLFDPPATAPGARTASTTFSKAQVEAAKFFLTAHSRGPELNVFGQPRVAIWPISSQTNSMTGSYRSATDQLIAFCSSTQGTNSVGAAVTNSYYFTRDPTVGLTFGGYQAGLLGRNSSTGDVNLSRNVSLLGYLDGLTGQVLPGNLSATATFNSKYTQLGKRQILTEMFDYVRITNVRDPLLDPQMGLQFPPSYTVSNNSDYGTTNSVATTSNTQGDGQILPTYYATWGTYGYGRFSGVLIDATLTFVGVGQGVVGAAAPKVVGYPTGAPSATANCSPVPQAQVSTVYSNPNSPAPYKNAAPASPAATYATAMPYDPTPASTAAGFAPVGGVPPNDNTAVQAVLSLSFFDPASGFSMTYPEYTAVVVSPGLSTLKLNGISLNFPSQTTALTSGGATPYGQAAVVGGSRPWTSFLYLNQLKGRFTNGNLNDDNNSGYPLFSDIISVPNTVPSASAPTMTLSGGGKVTINIYPLTANSTTSPAVTPIHTYVIDLSKLAPVAGTAIPVPGLTTRPLFGSIRSPALNTTATAAPWPDRLDSLKLSKADANGEFVSNIVDTFNDTVISMVPTATYGDYRMLAPYSLSIPSTDPIQAGTAFQVHPNFSSLSASSRLAYNVEYAAGGIVRGSTQGKLITAATYYPGTTNGSVTVVPPLNPGALSSIPLVPLTVSGPTAGSATAVSGGPPPDFDNGYGPLPDGPYINKPDEGVIFTHVKTLEPYFDNITVGSNLTNLQSFSSPERQVTSPVMFGSLPTGAPVGTLSPKPWQTLLFQPGMTGHAGLATPKDEYLLDLFWMPQSEPYAISEPFSTAGKVNLNYQIFPFTYIDRSTALQSVLASEKVAMVGANQGTLYKTGNLTTGQTTFLNTTAARFSLNTSEVDGTLRQFAQKFANYDFFHTAAEICDVYLVPQGQSWSSDATAQAAFYDFSSAGKFALVGDNTREKPYGDIYSRITTKSNSFTIYYRVQTLKNPPTSGATTWTEGQGAVLGDFRGSTTLERYIDPNDASVPDYTANTTAANLENHYKWRVVENTRFSP